mgnify:CR=1 FL=1
MPFKKLHSDIREKLDDLEIITPTSFQSKSIPGIKSGEKQPRLFLLPYKN